MVRSVGNADVEIRQVDFDEIADENVQFPLLRPVDQLFFSIPSI